MPLMPKLLLHLLAHLMQMRFLEQLLLLDIG
jgi:hypothetical protein